MTIAAEISSLSPTARIELFQLDASAIGGPIQYFHAGTNQLAQPVIWQGQQYLPFPIQASGFDKNSQGSLPRPKLSIANVTNLLSQLMLQFDDLKGALIYRRITALKFLDAINFPGGINPTADPTQALPDEIWEIDRKISEDANLIQFELISSLDRAGSMLPRRPITANLCWWQYRDANCGYTGPAVDVNGNPTSDPTQDGCSLLLGTGCTARFGTTVALPFGGFPGASLVRS